MKKDFIVNWLKEYSVNSKTNGFVVGVSGGIDSAVVSTLCALTGLPTLVVSMPIRQSNAEYDRATEHIDWLLKYQNVSVKEINLTSSFEAIEANLPTEIQDHLTMANTRSRLRMTTLYAFACHNKMLVVGTGNKVEDFGVGFFTKYGDGGVDISPIGDLMKSEVYALGAELGIVDSILQARPTDGLWTDGRTDEDQIGATYDELEWAMNYIENSPTIKLNGVPLTELVMLTDRQKQVLQIYKRLHTTNKHKMVEIPVCKIPK
jgi:NAD+ synthase